VSDRTAKVLHVVERIGVSARSLDLRLITPGQRWKLRRDLVIFAAASQGFSLRLLADVFDLPHSRISAILKNMREKYGPDQS
jgi:hypothetical protein